MQLAKFPYMGHTEYLASTLGGNDLMMMVNDKLRIALATNHLPIKDVASAIKKEAILAKINAFSKSLTTDFGIERATIAVLGLNPHAGDQGALGKEDDEIIKPAVIEAKKSGLLVSGPYAADGFFGSAGFTKVDGILAMYHDQGLVAFKALSFGKGTNFTAGLSYIRTSPDHGTAYDIAGQDMADPSSMREAIFTALDIAQSRKDYHSSRENALQKKDKGTYNEEEDEILEEA
jgi:4-hydroxythreonine-4-phosphate dehydrogenase